MVLTLGVSDVAPRAAFARLPDASTAQAVHLARWKWVPEADPGFFGIPRASHRKCNIRTALHTCKLVHTVADHDPTIGGVAGTPTQRWRTGGFDRKLRAGHGPYRRRRDRPQRVQDPPH